MVLKKLCRVFAGERGIALHDYGGDLFSGSDETTYELMYLDWSMFEAFVVSRGNESAFGVVDDKQSKRKYGVWIRKDCLADHLMPIHREQHAFAIGVRNAFSPYCRVPIDPKEMLEEYFEDYGYVSFLKTLDKIYPIRNKS